MKDLDAPHLPLLNTVDVQPIFLLGLARSGTTLLYKLLSQPQAFAYFQAYHIVKYDEILHNHVNKIEPEARAALDAQYQASGVNDRGFDRVSVASNFPAEYRVVLQNKGKLPHWTLRDCLQLLQGKGIYDLFFEALKVSPECTPLLLEACKKVQCISASQQPLLLKNPWDSTNFIYLQSIFPQAKFIYILRDPLDILNSQLKALHTIFTTPSQYLRIQSKIYQKLAGNRISFAGLRFLLLSPRTRKFRLGILLHNIIATANYIQTHLAALAQDQILFLTYEQLCRQPDATLQRIMDFLQVVPQKKVDYAALIAPRSLQRLPELVEHEEEIRQKLQPYEQLMNSLEC